MTVLFRSTGSMHAPSFFVRRRGGDLSRVRMPATVAVVERPDGLVLVDAGWSRYSCAFPERHPGLAASLALGLEVRPEDALASQLLSLGYDPRDVRHVVCTHLHIDHAGGAVDFPQATLHCTEDEWRILARGHRSYDPRLQGLPHVRPRALHGPPALGFPASEDLFGDGTVLLLDARGHTRGSMAVAVRLQEGWMVHAGDAAMFAEDFRDDASPPSLYMHALAWDIPHQREGWRSLHRAELDHAARVVPSHDLGVYDALPHTREDAWKGAWVRARKAATKKR